MQRQIPLASLADHVGLRLGPSSGILVDQGRIDRFADLTNDHQWIHVDVERATREAGGTIAHGYLTTSLIPALTASLLTITGVGHGFNYGSNKVRFLAPVRSGQSVHAFMTIKGIEAKRQGWLLTSVVELFVAGSETPVCVAEILALLHAGEAAL